MNKQFIVKKVLGISLMVVAAIAVLGFAVMQLWNAVMTDVLHVPAINFWQAMGMLVLSKIFFGGFRGGWGRHRREWKNGMREKWQHMTPEEKEKVKQEWRSRCHVWKRNDDMPAGGAE